MPEQYSKPKEGTWLTVVTDWSDIVFLKNKFRTKRGIVVKSKSYDRKGTFRLKTKCDFHPESVIELNRVAEMRDYNDQEQSKENVREAKDQTFQIEGSKGKTYQVRQEKNGQWNCNCKGFSFRQYCKHIDRAKEINQEEDSSQKSTKDVQSTP